MKINKDAVFDQNGLTKGQIFLQVYGWCVQSEFQNMDGSTNILTSTLSEEIRFTLA